VSTDAREFGYINVTRRTFTRIRQDPDFVLRAIAWNPANKTMYGEEVLPTSRITDTVTINPVTGTTADVGRSGFNINGLGASDTGQMIGTNPTTGTLLTVSTTTGRATFFANTPNGFTFGGGSDVVFQGGTILVTAFNQTGRSTDLLAYNARTGALIKDVGAIGFGGVEGLAFANGVLYGTANDQREVISINTTTGRGTGLFAYPASLNNKNILDATSVPEPGSIALMGMGLLLAALTVSWSDRRAVGASR
jgi:hypothetical protein